MKNKKQFGTAIIVTVLLLAAIFFIISFIGWKKSYQGRVFPGVSIGSLSLSGKTKEEANQAIISRFNEINLAGLLFQYADQSKKLELNIASFDSDLARQTLSFDQESSLSRVFDDNKQSSFIYYIFS